MRAIRQFRKLVLPLAITAALTPLGALALGMGDLQTLSYLNQRFNGRIPLQGAIQVQLDDVKARLASPEAFQRAGLDRSFLLTKMQFLLEKDADGQPQIRVISKEPIREPYLNFLVEVEWSGGQLLKEYTALLDPPELVTAAASKAHPWQAPAVKSDAAVPRPAQESRRARKYGPVRGQDTLWNIAKSMNIPGATPDQVMLALLEKNPDAFVNGNPHRLSKGAYLRLDSADAVFARGPEAARQLFRERSGLPATAESVEHPGSLTSQAVQAHVDQPVVEPPKVEQPKIDQLKVAETDANIALNVENERLKKRVVELETQLGEAQANLHVRDEELAKLREAKTAPVVAETPPVVKPRLPASAVDLSLPAIDEKIFTPQVTAATEPVKPQPPAGDASPPPPVVASSTEAAVPALPEVAPLTHQTSSEPVPAESPQVVVSPVTPEPPKAAPVDLNKPVAPSQPPRIPAPVITPEMQPLPSYWEELLATVEPQWLAGGGGGLLLLLLLLYALRRRSAKVMDEDMAAEDSVMTGDSKAITTDISGVDVNRPSFLSDFSNSEISALREDSEDVDPLSEADVYIAYGRYTQAEELIKQAIVRDPDRPELKQKLLDIHYATHNVAGFLAVAQSLRDEGFDLDHQHAWKHILGMGQELAPDSALFKGQATIPELADFEDLEHSGANLSGLEDMNVSELTRLEAGSPDFTQTQTDRFQAPKAKVSGDSEPVGLEISDSDLAILDIDIAGSSPELKDLSLDVEPLEPASSGNLDALQLDLDQLDDLAQLELDLKEEFPQAPQFTSSVSGDATQRRESAQSTVVAPLGNAAPEAPTFDPDELANALKEHLADSKTSRIGEEDSAQLADALSDLDFSDLSLDGLDLSDSADSKPAARAMGLDDLDSHLLEGAFAAEAGLLPDEAGDGLDAIDDVSTKLDLARAYIEIEDHEGARSILDEVLHDGDEQQKAEARELLKQL